MSKTSEAIMNNLINNAKSVSEREYVNGIQSKYSIGIDYSKCEDKSCISSTTQVPDFKQLVKRYKENPGNPYSDIIEEYVVLNKGLLLYETTRKDYKDAIICSQTVQLQKGSVF